MMCRQLMRALAALFLLAVYTQAEERGREPPFIQEPRTRSEMFVRRNQDVFLQCTAVGYPAIAYEWYWNDSPIQSTVITFDANTGTLQIKAITEREEGFFNCRAKNTYNGQEAIAISPKIEVRIARVGDFPPPSSSPVYTFTEGGYAKVPCDEKMPEHYGPTTFKWYKPIGPKLDEVMPNERIFIDQEGSVHFAYIMKSDENLAGNREYQCAMSNSIADTIKLGRGRQVVINAVGTGISEKKPALEYSTRGALLTVQRNANAQLECFFSGYENAATNAGKVPKVTWYDNQNNKIFTGGRYQLDSDGRVLIIRTVVEADEKTYTCEGTNTLGATRQQLILNVTSTPIWLEPLKSTTAVQGTNAIFNCHSRSAVSELAPGPPEWYKNGNRMGSSTDPTKYIWSDQNTKMTVKYVTKDRDITCFQCYVQNSVGIEFSDGCLNVILPITVTVQPGNLDQEISRGDVVNLTVVATSDPLTPLKYRWIYKNVTFELNNAPPHVIYDDITKLAYINTSLLTDEEYASIDGLYRREIYHQYEQKFIEVMVSRKEAPTAAADVTTAQPTRHHDVTCLDNRMSFSIPLPGNLPWTATLSDPRCHVDTAGGNLMSSINLNSCGTTVAFTNDSVIFRNVIIITSADNSTGEEGLIPIQCKYDRFATVQLSYMPVVRHVLFTEVGIGQLSFRIQQFMDARYLTAVADSQYPLRMEPNERVYIQLSLGDVLSAGHKDDIGIDVQECVASPFSTLLQAQSNSVPLIQESCPASNDVQLVTIYPEDIQRVRFSFKVVSFPDLQNQLGDFGLVFVHCRVSVCPADDCSASNRTCSYPSAVRRVRRSAHDRVSTHQLSTGPFLVSEDKGGAVSSTTALAAAVSMVVAAIATVVAMVAVVAWKRSRRDAIGQKC